MLIADGGGGGLPTTNWDQYHMPALWAHIEGQMTPGSTYSSPHWDHVAGWKKAIDLAALNRSRLKMLRDDILQVWPAERSPAAAAYVKHLDELIASLDQVHEHAVRNYEHTSAMVSSLASATHKVNELYQQWQAQQKIINGLRPDLDAPESPWYSPAGVSDLLGMPSKRDQAARGIADAQQAQADLEAQARTHLRTLSADLNSARSTVQPPPPYRAPTLGFDDPAGTAGGGEGGSISSPVIPPVVPVPAPAPAPAYKPVPLPPMGPDLSGVNTLPGTPPAGSGGIGTLPGTPPAGPSAPNPGTGLPPGVIRPLPGVIGGTNPANPAGRPGFTGGGIGGGIGGAGIGGGLGRSAMPAGGVIGASAGPVGSAGGVRANPPGGVIGGHPAASGPGGRSGPGGKAAAMGGVAAHGGMAGGPLGAGARPGQRRDSADQSLDPDTEWEVAEGVAPVLDAPDGPNPIDPGPAIGLR